MYSKNAEEEDGTNDDEKDESDDDLLRRVRQLEALTSKQQVDIRKVRSTH